MPMRDGRLLLVEDDDALADILVRYLRERGHVVVAVRSAEEAADALAGDAHPDLVILDLNLPGATGWDLLREGPLAGPGAPPVVVVSAMTVDPRRLAAFHVAGYLPKPFPLETLVDAIERLARTPSAEAGA